MTTAIDKAPTRFDEVIDNILPKVAEATARHVDMGTLRRVVLAEAVANSELRQCTTDSIYQCLVLAGQLGLSVSSPMGQSYLIPRKGQCTYQIGYRGYIELARRAGIALHAGVVYQSELDDGTFEWQEYPHKLVHYGAPEVSGPLVLAYAVATEVTTGQVWADVLRHADIERARGAAATNKVWSAYPARMYRKTAIRRLLGGGLVPLSAELQSAMESESDQIVLEPTEAARRRPVPPQLSDLLASPADIANPPPHAATSQE